MTPEAVPRRCKLELADAASARDYAQLTRRLTEAVAPPVGADAAGVTVWDEQRDVLRMLPGSFGADETTCASCQVDAADPTMTSARVFAERRSYLNNDARSDPRQPRAYLDLLGIRRLMSLPLVVSGRAVGVLHVANKPTPFTPADLEFVEAVAPQVATSLESFRAVFAVRRQQRLDAILARTAVGIASGVAMSDRIAEALRDLAGAIEANLVVLMATDRPPLVTRRGRRRPETERAVLAAARVSPEAALADMVPPRAPGDPGQASIVMPVRLSDRRLATLLAVRYRGEPFAHEEAEALRRLADVTALAWATEQYADQRAELMRLRERQRIADDLHDGVVQIVFAAQIDLESVLERSDLDPEVDDALTHARRLLMRGDTLLRGVIHQLSGPPRGNVGQRVHLVAAAVAAEFRIPVRIDIADAVAEAAEGIGGPAADAIVRVAREAIVNAAKHAGPCSVVVRLRIARTGRLVLTVRDDGAGLADGKIQRNRHGLASLRRELRDHDGRLRVAHPRSGGTTVIATVPL